ncbi:unnamed protein product, partial [Rotaria sp. Silwood2]
YLLSSFLSKFYSHDPSASLFNLDSNLTKKNPIYSLTLAIGAASVSANSLTLYKLVQFGFVADLTIELKNKKNLRNDSSFGIFSLTSQLILSFSLTLQCEVLLPLTNIDETIQIGALSNLPYEYSSVASNQRRTRKFDFLNEKSTALATA